MKTLLTNFLTAQPPQRRSARHFSRRRKLLRMTLFGVATCVSAGALSGCVALRDAYTPVVMQTAAAAAPETPPPMEALEPCGMPVTHLARISAPFGQRRARGRIHQGLDFAAPTGEPVFATAPGVVTASEWRGAYGRLVIVSHANGMETRYAHLSRFDVRKGARVARGETLGAIGSTGRSTGPHLHYEVRRGGKPLDPAGHIGRCGPKPQPEILMAANSGGAGPDGAGLAASLTRSPSRSGRTRMLLRREI